MRRLSQEQAVPTKLVAQWFEIALRKDDPRPTNADFEKLTDNLRVFLNRANNEELRKHANVPRSKLKDVSPAEEMRRKIDAVVNAAIDLENYAGPVLPTPKGNLLLMEFYTNLRMVRAVYANPPPRRGPGKPISSWKPVGLKVGLAVEALLKKIGYRHSTSLHTPHSATVIIASKAISWAYGINLKPNGFVSGMRKRSRAKAQRKLVS